MLAIILWQSLLPFMMLENVALQHTVVRQAFGAHCRNDAHPRMYGPVMTPVSTPLPLPLSAVFTSAMDHMLTSESVFDVPQSTIDTLSILVTLRRNQPVLPSSIQRTFYLSASSMSCHGGPKVSWSVETGASSWLPRNTTCPSRWKRGILWATDTFFCRGLAGEPIAAGCASSMSTSANSDEPSLEGSRLPTGGAGIRRAMLQLLHIVETLCLCEDDSEKNVSESESRTRRLMLTSHAHATRDARYEQRVAILTNGPLYGWVPE
jgi:hypothetical protein